MIDAKPYPEGSNWERAPVPGRRVRVGEGHLCGLEGTVVAEDVNGRVLIQLQPGVSVELLSASLELLD